MDYCPWSLAVAGQKSPGVGQPLFGLSSWDARSMVQKTYPLKHLKKQLYWWAKQGSILRNAHAVCFTTEEECLLPRRLFSLSGCEVVTGLGVMEPPVQTDEQAEMFHQKYPQLKGKKGLLYLGRFHPKKGVDDLIRAWKNRRKKQKKFWCWRDPWKKALAGLNF